MFNRLKPTASTCCSCSQLFNAPSVGLVSVLVCIIAFYAYKALVAILIYFVLFEYSGTMKREKIPEFSDCRIGQIMHNHIKTGAFHLRSDRFKCENMDLRRMWELWIFGKLERCKNEHWAQFPFVFFIWYMKMYDNAKLHRTETCLMPKQLRIIMKSALKLFLDWQNMNISNINFMFYLQICRF